VTYAIAQTAVIIVGIIAAAIAARAFVELLVRAERRARDPYMVHRRTDRW